MVEELTYEIVENAVKENTTAFRCVTRNQPAGGEGDKVFPPTYEGGKYATETRRLPGIEDVVDCVLLDSVQSQANRMELALLEYWERNRKNFPLPVITVAFNDKNLEKQMRITSLEAPHRIADAILRDSKLGDEYFRHSEYGRRVNEVDNKNATALFELNPTSLIFGMWDSTGPKGGLGAKFARALVSEMIGTHAQAGVKTKSRIDPLMIFKEAGPLYQTEKGGWTLEEKSAKRDSKNAVKLGEDGSPSEANHGNILPSIDRGSGGFTIKEAIQTTVLSLPALRRLQFPVNGNEINPDVNYAAQTALAALGLCAASLARDLGCDLRSRCLLHPVEPYTWEKLEPGKKPDSYSLSKEKAVEIYQQAVKKAKEAGLPWLDGELELEPSKELMALVLRSQELAAQQSIEAGEE